MGECNPFGIGEQCVFVRLAGCNLRCYRDKNGNGGCDTPEALTVDCGTQMYDWDIVEKVKSLGTKLVCLTGGEPMLQDCSDLCKMLVSAGYSIVVETNGSRYIGRLRKIKNLHFVVDCKAPSTGQADKMLDLNYPLLRKSDFVKFVVKDKTDLDYMVRWLEKYRYCKAKVSVGLFWGSELTYKDLVMFIRTHGLDVSINFQAHKLATLYDSHISKVYELEIPREI